MSHEYRVSEDDYVAALRLATAQPARRRLFSYVMIALSIGVAVWSFGDTAQSLTFVVSAIVAVVLIALEAVTLVILPRRFRTVYRNDTSHQQVLTARLGRRQLELSSDQHSVKIPWSEVVRWRENDRFVLLFTTPVQFQIVPKRIADAGFDIDALRVRLQEHVGPAA